MDHYTESEKCLRKGKVLRAIAHALLALVDEFRKPEPFDPLDPIILGPT